MTGKISFSAFLVLLSLLSFSHSSFGIQPSPLPMNSVLTSPDLPSTAGLPQSSRLPSLKIGDISFNPYGQIGYQKIGSNITFPLEVQEIVPVDNTLQIGTMELFIQDAVFWSGGLGLNVVVNPRISLFATGAAFFPRDILAPSILPLRINGISLPSRIEFTGTNVNYWAIQAGAAYNFSPHWAFVGGFLWDHFTMNAVNPRVRDVPFPNQTLKADYLSTSAVPFVGLQLADVTIGYRILVQYSPLASVDLQMALRSSNRGFTRLNYTFKHPGQFVAGVAEYDLKLAKTATAGVWLLGSWMSVYGDGEFGYSATEPAIQSNHSESGASINKYSLGFGIVFNVLF